jgi:DNA-binding CsgD family transcriptional regulator/PAS domain-containing protein
MKLQSAQSGRRALRDNWRRNLADNLYVQAVESIYAGGLGEELVPEALAATGRLLGASAATLEVIDKATLRPIEFHSTGLPAIARMQYFEQFAAINPRIPPVLSQRPGEVSWDYKLLDERVMARDPFYCEFLPKSGMRYFISAVLEQTPDKTAAVSVQRTRRQGHASDREIRLMQRLSPHFQRAYHMRARLTAVPNHATALEDALDLLADGVALLRRDGGIVYANEALRILATRGNDFRIDRKTVEFPTTDLRNRFATALSAVQRIGDPEAAFGLTDFAVPRAGGLPPFTVSLRPLTRARPHVTHSPDAVAMLLIHDPLLKNSAICRMLQELYGLTNAEAHLVQALGTGMTAVAYAQSRRVSVTTVYTHLRRTREKTGWKSVAELTRRFHELNVALRAN